jgi:hypothetical protein
VRLEASESATQPMMGMGGMSPIMLKELGRGCGFHSLDYGCCGEAQGRGRAPGEA